jgi:predicted nucleic acid-binding protein
VYLDVCCLNRPFDDQTQTRIRLEAEAVLLIIAQCEAGRWEWIASEVITLENSRNADSERRRRVQSLTLSAHVHLSVDGPIRERALQLEAFGFTGYDALHIGCAESANADVLLTTDDGMVRRANVRSKELRVQVMNPLTWVRKVRAA